METKGSTPPTLNIGETFMEDSIKRALKKLVKMKQINMRCDFKTATDKTVDFLIDTMKEMKE